MTTRREAWRAGAIGLLGLGMAELNAARSLTGPTTPKARSMIFVFLTGGLSHFDSLYLKQDAADGNRGEFRPIATRTTGVRISEHLPRLAQRTDKYAIVRSVATASNGHEEA